MKHPYLIGGGVVSLAGWALSLLGGHDAHGALLEGGLGGVIGALAFRWVGGKWSPAHHVATNSAPASHSV